jgi:LacI family transcriptional regulator
MATIKDIARECGVSANSVSCVINNKPGQVSAKTRSRVLSAIQRLGYRPNAAARRMVGKRTHTLGIADRYTALSLSDPYKTQILEPIIQTARSRRYDVLYYSGHAGEEQIGGFPSFLDGRCDGLLCFAGSIAPKEVEAILQTDLPVVFIGEAHIEAAAKAGLHGAVIDVDNEMGAYLGVSHLVGLGHTRIAMMQGVGISGNLNRAAGYRRALTELGLTVEETLLYPTPAWEEAAYTQGKMTLTLPAQERPTAVFCFNDALAFGLLRAAAELGIRCPEQLSIVGFDDVLAAQATVPPLTTVRQPLAEIGARAVAMLIGIIDGSLPRNHSETTAPQLIVRGSTAPRPA